TYVTLLNNTDGSVGEVTVKGTKGETVISKANTGALLDGSSKQPFAVDAQQLQDDFGAALKAQPPLPESFLLYFQEGGTHLTPESEAMLPKISAAIVARKEVDISIIGHSDTTGAAKLNEQLAHERAVYVSGFFDPAKLHIKEMTVTSHGEKNPLIKTADDVSEPKNRRVEITVR
ncbi:MAG: OmpA family protein, partial [Methylococcaceae bacterium]|nr:OmpA family protein [Methylococcaceae bacterium]